jgi:hypothetical protein
MKVFKEQHLMKCLLPHEVLASSAARLYSIRRREIVHIPLYIIPNGTRSPKTEEVAISQDAVP